MISSRPINPHENIIKRVTAVQGQEVKLYKRGDVAPLVVRVSSGTAVPPLLPRQAQTHIPSSVQLKSSMLVTAFLHLSLLQPGRAAGLCAGLLSFVRFDRRVNVCVI